jgi:hypothetical protein
MGTERGVLTMRGEGKGQDLTSETSTVVSRRRWRVPGEDGGIGTAGLSPPRPGHVQKKTNTRGYSQFLSTSIRRVSRVLLGLIPSKSVCKTICGQIFGVLSWLGKYTTNPAKTHVQKGASIFHSCYFWVTSVCSII